MKKYLLIVALFTAAVVFAQSQQTVSKSEISYEIKNMGINTHGKFSGLKSDIKFNPKNLGTSSIEASVDASTINSDNEMRDKHLRSDDYFDVAKYPRITMKSTSLKSKGGNNYVGMFNVTIKDKTKPVEVPFTYTEAGKVGTFNGEFKIDRKDFGVGGNSLTLGNETTIKVNIETTK